MSRRRFTTEELEELVVKERLKRATKLSVFRELGAFCHRGILLAACAFKQCGSEDLTAGLQSSSHGRRVENLINVEEAAAILRVDKSWIYRREDRLPFVVRLGEGTVRVCKRGLMEYIEKRIGNSGDRSPPS